VFNVLVSGHEAEWESGQRMRMHASRFLEMSGDEARRVALTDAGSLKALERAHALLMYEKVVKPAYAEQVRVGHLRDIQFNGADVSFRFAEIGRIPRATVWDLRHRLQIDDFAFHRTHWAVKDGGIPQDVLGLVVATPRQYDIVLSFAGEDRAYVEEVAEKLEQRGVDVFYDKFEKATLWGKDLAEHFDGLYRQHARFCVMFISKHYAEKVWTTHERRAALARAMAERTEYVLPARFDDTEIPGLRPTISYVDLREESPEQLADLVLQKLGRA
jgi:hypothetical protein